MSIKNSGRQSRVAAEIKKVLSEFLLHSSRVDYEGINPAFISITDVTISSCLQHAKIYIASISQDVADDDCLEFFQKHAAHLRRHLGSTIHLKFVPDLKFFMDDSFDYAKKIESLLLYEKRTPPDE
ncbi:MAG: 30S ribosome-binding factor RbfA [Holosporaceae bacterium]|jgi:ribosome-binding factor A|nr:30S ribosome-binding factor RbfA [Holosporaceae bacterium]